ncbi:hypothetical protein GE061_011319 [Apolygus lucorum]|uniref:Uncharacterized protein n=1 Tax=Apolygus lucorum TaxID=248454 RepID=A0A8S9XZ90_APOLU|nr:hypothetical protein GE061_011319 [Apolygus lucorum]
MVGKTSKEDLALYQQMPKCYIKKKFKQGIKIADRLLAKECSLVVYSKTLAWKSLFWGLLGKPDVGMKNIQKALKKDGQSSLCWHVYGKLRTLKGEFEKAIDCYKTALAIAPNSVGVTKDLGLAQVQIGDVDGFKAATGTVLKSMPRSRQSWISFAVASHISGDLEGALNVLSSFHTQEPTKRMQMKPWDLSELLLYHNNLIQESGDIGQALTHLLENRHRIFDTTSTDESLMRMYVQTGQYQEALSIVQNLLEKNPNNLDYYNHLFTSLRLKSETSKADILETILTEFPDAITPKLLFLQYATGKKFINYTSSFIKQQLSKGSVNIFSTIKCVMKNEVKKDYIKLFLSKHKAALNKNLVNSNNRKAENELFSNIICTARILHHESNHVEALDTIKKAILMNPLASDGYITKARILKHLMNPVEACRAMEKAQRLEPADRWLEMKLVKYLLRADLVEEADKLYTDFLKNETENERVDHVWYLYEKASAHHRSGEPEKALELCQNIDDIFTNMENSNFEMHALSLENSSLRAYEQFLKINKNLRNDKYYLKAATLAVGVALQMQDAKFEDFKKQRQKFKRSTSTNSGGTTKKVTFKAKKMASSHVDDCKNDESSDSDVSPPNNDPDYFVDHLLHVRHFLRALQTHAPNEIETQLLSYEMYSRLRRPLLMMQSLLKARKINKDHHSLLVPTVHLHRSLVRWGAKEKLPQKKLAVLLEMGRKGLWRNKSMEELINVFLRKHGKNLPYLLEGAKALYLMYPAKREDAIK